jgi:hypothetical protein
MGLKNKSPFESVDKNRRRGYIEFLLRTNEGTMKKIKIALAAMACMCLMSSAGAEEAEKEIALQNPMDCSNMGADMQQFASGLNAMNKKMFCGQFNAAQRSTAMQYATQNDSTGAMMTPDKAVQKVAAENNMMPSSKSPTGCPVK